MKKFIMLIIFTLITIFGMTAREYTLYSGNAYCYSDWSDHLEPTPFLIKGKTGSSHMYLTTKNRYGDTILISFNDSELEIIRNAMIKYQEWVKIAKDNKLEAEKDIPKYEIKRSGVTMRSTNGNSYGAGGMELYFGMISQSKDRHQFYIYSNVVTPDENQFVKIQMETLYLDEADVVNFLENTKLEKITAMRTEQSNMKKLADKLLK